jgi:hypothetical protein
VVDDRRSGQYLIDNSMPVFFATISPLELAFWIALPVYITVDVILWCSLPVFRQAFRRYRYVGGMIAAALIWPFMLLQVAVVGIVFSIGWLSVNLLLLFGRKRRSAVSIDASCMKRTLLAIIFAVPLSLTFTPHSGSGYIAVWSPVELQPKRFIFQATIKASNAKK